MKVNDWEISAPLLVALTIISRNGSRQARAKMIRARYNTPFLIRKPIF
jgi:hypothetical protein